MHSEAYELKIRKIVKFISEKKTKQKKHTSISLKVTSPYINVSGFYVFLMFYFKFRRIENIKKRRESVKNG